MVDDMTAPESDMAVTRPDPARCFTEFHLRCSLRAAGTIDNMKKICCPDTNKRPSGPRLGDPPGPTRDRHRSSRGRSAGRARGAPSCQFWQVGGSRARPAVRGTAPRHYAQVASRCGREPQHFSALDEVQQRELLNVCHVIFMR